MQIQFNKNTTNGFEFDIKLRGLTEGEIPKVRFLIHQDDITYMVACKRVEENKYSVLVPPIHALDHKKTPSFSIEILADSYYFEPLKGSVQVIEKEVTAEVEQTTIVSKTESNVSEDKTVAEVITEQQAPIVEHQSKTQRSVHDKQAKLRKILDEVKTKKPTLPKDMSTDKLVEQLLTGTKYDPKHKQPQKPVVNNKVDRRVKAILQNF